MYIVIEGIDGSGKTTQCEMLAEKMRSIGRKVSVVKDLSQITDFGGAITKIIMSDTRRDSKSELFSFLACKAQLHREVIQPRIENHECVVADRGDASFLTYNLLRLDIGALGLKVMLDVATSDLRPTLTFLLDVPTTVATARKRSQRETLTRFDAMTPAFFDQQRQLFIEFAQKDPSWVIVDGGESKVQVGDVVWRYCQPFL